MNKGKLLASLLVAGGLVAPSAYATNGYFAHGYGTKAKGMGGAGIALPQDALAAATNPAGMVLIGNRVDFGLEWFSPKRDATIAGTKYTSDSNNFFIPEFGYNQMISNDSSLGISIYGNGGMNTDYPNIPNYNVAGRRVGVNLEQLFIAPTWATKLSPENAVGISLNLAYQRFAANGISNFGGVSSNAAALSDNGTDTSTGYGLRFGWNGQLAPNFSLGLTYQTKTKMSKLSKYSGLFANQGEFDIPENYGIGTAWKVTPDTTLAMDIEQINYSKVASIAHPIANMGTPGYLLGQSGGIGFGWKDQTVFKLGVSYAYSQSLTLRAGYNHGSSTIPTTEIAFNVLAPATVENHLTLGSTWTLENKSELSLMYMHAFSNSQSGATPQLGASPTTIRMHEDSLGISYGWKM